MNKKLDIWTTARETTRLLIQRYLDPMEKQAIEMGIPEFAWGLIIAARKIAPDPISVRRLRVKVPYNAPAHYEKQLTELVRAECLTDAKDGDHYLTQRGQNATTSIIAAATSQLESLTLLADKEMEDLVEILFRLIQFILVTQAPPCRRSMLDSRKIDQGPQAHSNVRLDQYLTDLSAFRDDAHLAAWSEYAVHPHAWDILGLIWSGRASSFKEIMEITHPRGWLEDQTVCSIEELLSSGWIEGVGEFHLSEEGRIVREAVEDKTNQYFFEPWKILSSLELERIDRSLRLINEKLESQSN